jgi:hypothetical protein
MKSDGFFGELEQSSTLDLFLEETFEQMITLRDIEALSDLTGRIRERRAATYSNCRLFLPEAGDSRSTQMNANLIK